MAVGGEPGVGRRVVDDDLSLRKDTRLRLPLRRHPDGRLVTETRRRREPDADRARIDGRRVPGKRDGRGAVARRAPRCRSRLSAAAAARASTTSLACGFSLAIGQPRQFERHGSDLCVRRASARTVPGHGVRRRPRTIEQWLRAESTPPDPALVLSISMASATVCRRFTPRTPSHRDFETEQCAPRSRNAAAHRGPRSRRAVSQRHGGLADVRRKYQRHTWRRRSPTPATSKPIYARGPMSIHSAASRTRR